jgi:hypothetical protein
VLRTLGAFSEKATSHACHLELLNADDRAAVERDVERLGGRRVGPQVAPSHSPPQGPQVPGLSVRRRRRGHSSQSVITRLIDLLMSQHPTSPFYLELVSCLHRWLQVHASRPCVDHDCQGRCVVIS